MKFWIDAQLPRAMSKWLPDRFGVQAETLEVLGLRHSSDTAIFNALRQSGSVIATKDSDFLELVARLGPPPQVLWITCGNVTNRSLKLLCEHGFPSVLELLRQGEPIVELGDK